MSNLNNLSTKSELFLYIIMLKVMLDRLEGNPHRDHPPLKYTIELITEDLIADSVEHLTKYFLVRENLMSSAAFLEDKVSVQVCQKFWRKVLKKGISLVALVKVEENGEIKRRIAGINLNSIGDEDDDDDEEDNEEDDEEDSNRKLFMLQGEAVKKTVRTMHDLEKDVDIASLYGTTKYLKAYGLSVARHYNGDGVGYQLLMTTTLLCRALGIGLIVTAFTSPLSQYLARKAGFETIRSLDYKTYKHDGKLAYPRLDGTISLMAKRIPDS